MTQTTSDMNLWRPQDGTLLVPEFALGWPVLQRERPEVAAVLVTYLTELVRRRYVVHTAVAFNAVSVGYDLDFGGYSGGPVDFAVFPDVTFGDQTPALPVGALVNVLAGRTSLPCEVIYKEGAHPELEERGYGMVSAWLSGAPAGARGPGEPAQEQERPLLDERWVIDVDAFSEGTVITHAGFTRLRRLERGVDTLGHVRVQARYPSAAAAEDDDLEFYIRHLLYGAGRPLLVDGPVPLMLTDAAGERELEQALRGCIGTVRDALASIDELRHWRDFAFTRESMHRRLADTGDLGGDAIRDVTSMVASPPRRLKFQTRPPVGYTSVGQLLRTITPHPEIDLAGTRYALTVCHANTAVASRARDADEDTGLLETGVHLRLDDAWQGGGVWRVSGPPDPHALIDPLVPLGLGWWSTLPADVAADDDTDAPEDGMPQLLAAPESHVSWAVPLRLRDVMDGTVRIPGQALAAFTSLDAADVLRLELAHTADTMGSELASQQVSWRNEQTPSRLTGATWPMDFFPGIVLTFSWNKGARVLRAWTTPLDPPEMVDGAECAFWFDPQVFTRDTAPGCPARGKPRNGGALSLRDRVLRALRRTGLLDPDGVAALERKKLAAGIYGDRAGNGAEAALEPVVAELLACGALRLEWGRWDGGDLRWPMPAPANPGDGDLELLVWRPTRVAVPRPRAAEPELLPAPPVAPVREHDIDEGLRGYLATYEVAPFLRRLPPGQQASQAAQELYQQLRARIRSGPATLPRGWTVVRRHERSRWW